MEFLNAARDITPPFVVQKHDGCATILTRVVQPGGGAVFKRVECETPQEVISAWMALVERHNGGTYTRKARVSDLIQAREKRFRDARCGGRDQTGVRSNRRKRD